MMRDRALRVLLVDDHTLVRAGIRSLLESQAGIEIVAEADNGRDAAALAKRHGPDVVIMDVSMPELNGIDATVQVLTQAASTRVLILSMHSGEEFVRRAMKAGASGYLVKDSAPQELMLALHALSRGETYLSSRVSRHLVRALSAEPGERAESSLETLSPRQREVLQLIAEGRSTKEIAAALGLSVKTVETHRAALMARLDIHDIAGLVMYAARNKLISMDGDDTR
jgi:DNA-binding NarL/FixJ family response regulator